MNLETTKILPLHFHIHPTHLGNVFEWCHCLYFNFDSLPSSYTNLVGKPTTKVEAPKPSKEAYQVNYFSYIHFPLKDEDLCKTDKTQKEKIKKSPFWTNIWLVIQVFLFIFDLQRYVSSLQIKSLLPTILMLVIIISLHNT
jgi:hypothetical protein